MCTKSKKISPHKFFSVIIVLPGISFFRYCPEHAKKAAILRQKAIRKRKPRETSESLLEELAQHHGPSALMEPVIPDTRKSRLPSDSLANKVLGWDQF